MESSIAESLERQLACELLPTFESDSLKPNPAVVKRDLDSTPEQRKTCVRSVAERVHVHDTCDSICRQK